MSDAACCRGKYIYFLNILLVIINIFLIIRTVPSSEKKAPENVCKCSKNCKITTAEGEFDCECICTCKCNSTKCCDCCKCDCKCTEETAKKVQTPEGFKYVCECSCTC